MSIPRPEYPRPQLVRDRWLNLNGPWQFEIDRGDSGRQRGLLDRDLEREIVVPFAPESRASGIEDVDFLHAVWYRRVVTIPADWAGSDVLLHLGAVDHDATVWANGVEVARHRGGFTPFTADLTAVATPGEDVTIVVRARDAASGPQARGKQSVAYANADCHYTRTTGIWQTVWLEPVPTTRIDRIRITPRYADGAFDVEATLRRQVEGLRLQVEIRDADGVVATGEVAADDEMTPSTRVVLPEDRRRPWSTSDPHLYDVTVRLLGADGEIDSVESYAGLRSVSVRGQQILINGERVFQRLVLDQGYWPETLMTGPSDEALRADIELGIAAGFNGARLHQKVFEERYLYWADKLGYLVWGEFGDWGAGVAGPVDDHQHPTASFVTQWLEALERDVNHPAIIGWCPLNETWEAIADRITQLDDVTHAMYLATKLADPTRPVLDTSGYSHRVRGADVYDSHDYEQVPEAFARNHAGLAHGEPWTNDHDGRTISLPYAGQPYFCSEYGGIWWNAARAAEAAGNDRSDSWGYGQRVVDLDEWYTRFQGLTDVLLDDPRMFGYCYTQLTDTFQEENGIYDFERKPKFDLDRVRAIQTRPAAYEITGPPAD